MNHVSLCAGRHACVCAYVEKHIKLGEFNMCGPSIRFCMWRCSGIASDSCFMGHSFQIWFTTATACNWKVVLFVCEMWSVGRNRIWLAVWWLFYRQVNFHKNARFMLMECLCSNWNLLCHCIYAPTTIALKPHNTLTSGVNDPTKSTKSAGTRTRHTT